MDHTKTLLTIGIPVYNAIEFLPDLLRSIETELRDLSHEVIVVDDGSTDGTSELILSQFPQIQYIREQKNIGVSKATDLIISHMQGKYLLRLDADTIVNRIAITKLIEKLDSDTKIGVIGPSLVDQSGRFQPSFEMHFKTPVEWFWDYFLWGKKLWAALKGNFTINESPRAIEVAYLASAAILVRKTAIDQVGGLDQSMEFFMEDADWILRIRQSGWKILYLPTVEMIHIGGQSGNLYIHCRDRSLKNLYYFYQKHAPGLVNQIVLSVAIIFGSYLSLIAALIFLPLVYFIPNSKISTIIKRSLSSFANVFAWHIRQLNVRSRYK